MKFNKFFNCIIEIFAAVMLIVVVLPNAGVCATGSAESMAGMATTHSCCATAHASCDTPTFSNDCCCKSAPIDRASTPGLIGASSTQFSQVAVLPPIPLPPNFQAQVNISRYSAVANAPPPKIYIFYRALLI